MKSRMRRIALRALALVGLVAVPLVLLPLVALAISVPSPDPSVSEVHGNTYLLESGDILIYFDFNIPYALTPDEAASETYYFRLIDTDNVTELGGATPSVLMDNGYNKGVSGFYFEASDNITWGELYIIRISQNPIYSASPESWDYVMATSSYTTSTTQEANQTELAINLISAAERLEAYHTTYTFLDTSPSGTVLSSPTGETYFRGAIYGVQSMASAIFLVQTLDVTSSHTYLTTQAETYEGRFEATWIGASTNATETQFGLTGGSALGMGFILPTCVGVIILTSMRFRKAEPGIVISALLLVMALLMGWMPYAIFASLYQVMGIYLAYVLFMARA